MRPKLLQGVWCALDVGRVYARGERRRDTRRPSWVAGPGQAGVPVCLWQNPGPGGHSCRAFPNLDQTSEIFPLLRSLPHRVFVTTITATPIIDTSYPQGNPIGRLI